eukprot:TRINITY_DN5406_c2_g3_i1.p1 TRINITY_DN5406_c2_g3~~TRINITY_DN5406_c2_g3_i1.p1  ORF type:complete len:417 (+),score=51.65 TRINITY_DN5406_c2_g3_i1:62-1252(+)
MLTLMTMTAGLTMGWDPKGLANTPLMGWNNWGTVGCNYNDSYIREVADSMSTGGLQAAGYHMIILQGCIVPKGSRDNTTHAPIVDPEKFPNGMKSLADYVHTKNLTIGITTSTGTTTCEGFEGSYGYETIDAATYQSWGLDMINEQVCGLPNGAVPKTLFTKMQTAITASNSPMLLYMDAQGQGNVETWGPSIGTVWSTSTGLNITTSTYNDMFNDYNNDLKFPNATSLGAWQDPGLLMVGSPELTPEEWETHFSLWAIAAAPLFTSFNVVKPPYGVMSVYTNTDVIAVNQDPLAKMGLLVVSKNATNPSTVNSVWVKPMSPAAGESQAAAVLLINTDDSNTAEIILYFADIFPGVSTVHSVRDLWEHKDLGSMTTKFSASLSPHVSIALRVAITA